MTTLEILRIRVALRIKNFLGVKAALDRRERARRLVEEAIELAQAEGVPEHEVALIAQRVFSRPIGDPVTEGGDVGLTYLAWTHAAGLDMHALVTKRLDETANMRARIRASAAAKAQAGIGLPPEGD